MIDDQTVCLVKASVAIARGDPERVRTYLGAARAFAVPKGWIEELLLQSFLNVGYPLTLAAWQVWREMSGPYEPAGEPLDHEEWRQWQSRGGRTCARVYGDSTPRLLLNLRALHPAVEAMVIVDAYGKIIGRGGLDLKVRELCTLAAVATLSAPRQLRAHLQGALNVGWTKEQVDLALTLVEEQVGAERALKIWEEWAGVRGAERGA
jgi:4-carboxymuconolactone decarboxylase